MPPLPPQKESTTDAFLFSNLHLAMDENARGLNYSTHLVGKWHLGFCKGKSKRDYVETAMLVRHFSTEADKFTMKK
jgi:hypothetical protein